MEELIRVSVSEGGKRIVSGIELFDFLDVKTTFAHWIKRMLSYGFTQDVDYQPLDIFVQAKSGVGGKNKIDYALTLDTAKEISMIQRSDKGKLARKYFIACENKLKEIVATPSFNLPTTFPEALRMLADTSEAKEKVEIALNKANLTLEEDKPKVIFASSVEGSSNSILVREFAKDISDDTFKIGQNRVYQWFRDKKYMNTKNEPYQKYIDQGLFEVVTRTVGSADKTFQTKTTKITGKGSVYFAHKIKESL